MHGVGRHDGDGTGDADGVVTTVAARASAGAATRHRKAPPATSSARLRVVSGRRDARPWESAVRTVTPTVG
jgi:hypothetical protein